MFPSLSPSNSLQQSLPAHNRKNLSPYFGATSREKAAEQLNWLFSKGTIKSAPTAETIEKRADMIDRGAVSTPPGFREEKGLPPSEKTEKATREADKIARKKAAREDADRKVKSAEQEVQKLEEELGQAKRKLTEAQDARKKLRPTK